MTLAEIAELIGSGALGGAATLGVIWARGKQAQAKIAVAQIQAEGEESTRLWARLEAMDSRLDALRREAEDCRRKFDDCEDRYGRVQVDNERLREAVTELRLALHRSIEDQGKVNLRLLRRTTPPPFRRPLEQSHVQPTSDHEADVGGPIPRIPR